MSSCNINFTKLCSSTLLEVLTLASKDALSNVDQSIQQNNNIHTFNNTQILYVSLEETSNYIQLTFILSTQQ